jgi:uncharacterized protein
LTRVGVSFHPALAAWLEQAPPEVQCVEILAERFFGDARALANVLRARHPLIVRTELLSLASPAWDASVVPSIASFAAETQALWITDHLGFRFADGLDLGKPCPTSLNRHTLERVAARTRDVMSACGTRLLIRNVASPLAVAGAIPEPEFLCRLCELTGCELSLDVCALLVNARNHRFDALEWLAGIDPQRIAHLHVGGCREVDGLFDDTHDAPVDEDGWRLVEDLLRTHAPEAVTLQWEARFPPTSVIACELLRLKALTA